MNRKHFILAALVAILALSALIGTTSAYIVVSDSVTNTLSAGETKDEIIEQFPETEVSEGVEATLVKEVAVENTGNLPAHVRVRLVFSDTGITDKITLVFENTELWSYDEATDFYYYKEVVASGESTELLISGVVASAELASGEDFAISVYSELTHHESHDGECSDTEYVDVWSSDAG